MGLLGLTTAITHAQATPSAALTALFKEMWEDPAQALA